MKEKINFSLKEGVSQGLGIDALAHKSASANQGAHARPFGWYCHARRHRSQQGTVMRGLQQAMMERLLTGIEFKLPKPERLLLPQCCHPGLAWQLAEHWPAASLEVVTPLRHDLGLWPASVRLLPFDEGLPPLYSSSLSGHYDGVIIEGVNSYGEPEQLWQALLPWLRVGGSLYFSQWGVETGVEWRRHWAKQSGQALLDPWPDLHQTGDQLKAVGYDEVIMVRELLSVRYRGFDRFWRHGQSLGLTYGFGDSRAGCLGWRRWQKIASAFGSDGSHKEGSLQLTYEVNYGCATRVQKQQPRVGAVDEVSIPISDIQGISGIIE